LIYKPPKNISIAREYVLYIHDNFGLQQIEMHSKFIDDDSKGNLGKETYSAYKEKLVDIYGDPVLISETVELNKYIKVNDFYDCLKSFVCSWKAIWGSDERGTVLIGIESIEPKKGYIKIIYTSKDWITIVNENKNIIEQDKNSL
jgi:hypothetical protein